MKTLREAPSEQVAVIGGNVVPSAVDTEAIVEGAATEEPLPFVMAEMALWGTAMSALMIPIGLFTLVASPFAVARDIFRSKTQESVAVAG